MKSRPGMIILLAIFNFFGPLPSILISASLSHLSLTQYLAYRTHFDPIGFVLGAFVLNSLAAAAIFSMRRWSLPVCIGITLWNAIHTSSIFQHYDSPLTASAIILCHFLNLATIAYFLLPAVRKAYLDRSLQWWKSEVRYQVTLPGKVWIRSSNQLCKISEISKSGVFVKVDRILGVGESLDFEFSFENQTYSFTGKILHRNAVHRAYGIHFTDLNRATTREIKYLLKRFDSKGIQRNPEKVNGYLEFRNWLSAFARTGKGLIPQLDPVGQFETEIPLEEKNDLKESA